MINCLRRTVIGLDLHHEELQAIKLRKTWDGFCAENWEKMKLPKEIFADHSRINWYLLIDCLRELMITMELRRERCVLHLPNNLVEIFNLNFPLGFSKNEIKREVIKIYERSHAKFIEEFFFDFFITASKDQDGYVRARGAVVKKDFIKQYMHCMQTVGLQVIAIDVDIFALERVISFEEILIEDNHDKKLMTYFLNIRKNSIYFLVYKNMEVIFFETIPYGEDAIERGLLYLKEHSQKFNPCNLRRVFVAANSNYFEKIYSIFDNSIEKIHVNCFRHIRVNESFASNNEIFPSSDFLLAIGLAMR